MNYNLFLDDIRFPNPIKGLWFIARNCQDAEWYIRNFGIPEHISFDHDLGETENAMTFVKWFCEYVQDNNLDISNFTFNVHSMNPIGAENIKSYMLSFLKHYEKRG